MEFRREEEKMKDSERLPVAGNWFPGRVDKITQREYVIMENQGREQGHKEKGEI